MNWVHIVALLAILQYIAFTALVGLARMRYRIRAPDTLGHPMFERAFRVQQNTLEQLVAFLPALLLAGLYWPQAWIAGLGAVWLAGRLLYRAEYMKAPDSRSKGFALTLLPTVVLVLAALGGATLRG